eukprot:gene4454-3249_t
MFRHTDKSTWLSTVDRPNEPIRPIICPSILASDFSRLYEECANVLSEEGGAAEWLHVDVMDGHFVPNISIGPCVVQALRASLPDAFLDVHCMITDPEKWVKDVAAAGASQMTFHIEATSNPEAICKMIRDAGMQCGVAIKPKTGITADLKALVEKKFVDMVLVMTVEPGFGGQSFMEGMMPKVRELRQLYPNLNIQVDGGIGEQTVVRAAQAGANVLVAGTSIFKAKSRKETATSLRAAIHPTTFTGTESKKKEASLIFLFLYFLVLFTDIVVFFLTLRPIMNTITTRGKKNLFNPTQSIERYQFEMASTLLFDDAGCAQKKKNAMTPPQNKILSDALAGLLKNLSGRVRSLPHRDVTTTTYKEWLQTYVSGLQQLSAAVGDGPLDRVHTRPFCRELNATLLSSICAPRWSEVHLATANEQCHEEWWHQSAVRTGSAIPEGYAAEYITSAFLAEPLLGGTTLSWYLENVQQYRSSKRIGSSRDTPVTPPRSRLLIPFSTLWTIKCEMCGRGAEGGLPLSFQERQARRSLLQSVGYALQLTLAIASGDEPAISPMHVLTPCEEFEAICQLPAVRQRVAAAGVATSPWWSMESVCSNSMWRLIYLTHAGSVLVPRNGVASDSLRAPCTPVLLAPAHLHKMYRRAALPYVSERSELRKPPGTASNTHRQAVESRQAASRRLASREENIRQRMSHLPASSVQEKSVYNFDHNDDGVIDEQNLSKPLQQKHQYIPGSADSVRSMEALQTFLQTVPLLFSLTAEQISRLPVKIREYGAMNVVIEEGQVLQHVYVLASGTIEVMNSKKGLRRAYGHRRIGSVSAPNIFGIDDVIFDTPSEFTFHASTESTLLLISKKHIIRMFAESPLFANNVSNRMLQTLPAFRMFAELCKAIFGGAGSSKFNSQDGYLLPLATIVNIYKSSGTLFHKLANAPEIDTDALRYALKRLPTNISSTYSIILSTYLPGYLLEENVADAKRFDQANNKTTIAVDTGKRRRCAWAIGKSGQTIVIMRDSFTDIMDFVCNLCILVVESQKIQMRLRQLVSPSAVELLREAMIAEEEGGTSNVMEYMPFSKKELNALRYIWGNQFYSELNNIVSHREDYTVRMEPLRGKKFCEDPYASWSLTLTRHIKRCLQIGDDADIPEDIMIDVMFSNNRTLKQLFCTRSEDFRELVEKMIANVDNAHPSNWKNEDDRYYHILTCLLETEPIIREAYRFQLESNGFTLLEDAHPSALIVDLIDVSRIRPLDADTALYEEMKGASERARDGRRHFIINVDKTFGAQVEAVLRSFLLTFGNRIRSVNLTGKAGGLVGCRGDIALPTKLLLSKQSFGEDSTDEIRTCNATLSPDIISKFLTRSTSAKIHRGTCIASPGFVFQSPSVLKFYKVVHGCTAADMQSSYVKRQLEECRRTGIISNQVRSRYLFYFDDMPFGNEDGSEIRMMKKEMFATTFATIRCLLHAILSPE